MAIAAVALCALATGASGAGPDMPGPVLPSMVLASSDLAPGAALNAQGYRPAVSPVVAEYQRNFGPGVRLGGWPLYAAQSLVQDYGDVGTATIVFDQVRHDLNTTAGRRRFGKLLSGVVRPASGVTVSSVTVTLPQSMAVAQSALRVTVRMRLKARGRTATVEIAGDFLLMDRTVGIVALASYPRKRVPTSIAVLAARKVAAHFKAAYTVRNLTKPRIGGAVGQGLTLTANPGTWDGAPSGYAYQWRRCDANGENCAAIPGAVTQTYLVASPDAGARIVVAVTAANSVTSTTLVTQPTDVVR